MKDNQSKKVGGRNFEEEFGQALFFVSPTPHYLPRETKIEPDRRLEPPQIRNDPVKLKLCHRRLQHAPESG